MKFSMHMKSTLNKLLPQHIILFKRNFRCSILYCILFLYIKTTFTVVSAQQTSCVYQNLKKKFSLFEYYILT